MSLGLNSENSFVEGTQEVAVAVASQVQQTAESFQHSNQNVRPVLATEFLPPTSWVQSWFVIGAVGLGLLGLAYIVLRKD